MFDTALRIARYSYIHRDPSTGLVPNEPDMGRWDSKVCTSEIGLWAQCLLRAADYTGCDEFASMASNAVHAYLDCAFDPKSARFFGQVGIHDGRPVFPEKTGYWPRKYANPWNTDQWPTHDYPISVAEACLTLHERTGERAFLEGARRWRMKPQTPSSKMGCFKDIQATACTNLSMAWDFCCWRSCCWRIAMRSRCTNLHSESERRSEHSVARDG